jgi:hypothetical protein
MENVQPLKLGKVFSYSFNLLGKDFWKMFLTVTVSMLILMLPVALMIAYAVMNSGRFIDMRVYDFAGAMSTFSFLIVPYVVLILLAFALSPFMYGIPLILSASRMHGRPLSFREAFLLTGQKYGRLLLTTLSEFVLIILPLAVYILVIFGITSASVSGLYNGRMPMGNTLMFMPVLFLLQTALYAVSIYIGLVFQYATCITVNEDSYAFPAIFRAFSLVNKSGFWKNIGHFVVMMLCVGGAGMVIGLFGSMFILIMAVSPTLLPAMGTVIGIIVIACSAVLQLFSLVYVQLMYYNSRIATEGYGF